MSNSYGSRRAEVHIHAREVSGKAISVDAFARRTTSRRVPQPFCGAGIDILVKSASCMSRSVAWKDVSDDGFFSHRFGQFIHELDVGPRFHHALDFRYCETST